MNQQQEFEFDTQIFKEYLRSKLIVLFEQMPGKKLLIIDKKVHPLINLSIEYSALQETGIKQTVALDIDIIDKDFSQVVIIIPPKVAETKRVAKIIKDNEGIGQQKQYMLVFWPQRTILCKEILEQEGVISSLELRDFSFDLIPLDQDVLSLEMHDAFRDMTIENDLSIYNYVAESISRIQLVMGSIPNIYIKGDGAKMVYDIIKLEQAQREEDNQVEAGDIESLLIFDRSVDLLTPMLTQLVYEGLIDEFFEINGNFLWIDKKVLGKEGDDKTVIQLISEKDPLLYQVRNLLLAPLGLYLREKAEQQERDKEEFNREKQKNITEKMVQTAKRIKAEQESVQKHVNISTKITQMFRTIQFYKQLNSEQGMINGEKSERTLDYLEAMIQVKEDITKVMRLMAMRSLIDGGLKPKPFDYYRREIIQVYGFKIIDFLQNLQKAGLFTRQENTKPVWPKLQESLKLLDVDIRSDDPNPKDPAYTYSGHCPLIARLIETIFLKNTWKSLKNQMVMIPGATIEPEKFVKTHSVGLCHWGLNIWRNICISSSWEKIQQSIEQIQDKEIIICTTHITNGTKLINSLREKL